MPIRQVAFWAAVIGVTVMIVVFATFGVWQIARQGRFLVEGERVPGQIVDDVTCVKGSELTTCSTTIAYRTGDGRLMLTDVEVSESSERGKAYWIYYLPSDPAQATTLIPLYMVGTMVLNAGMVVLALLGAFFGGRYVLSHLREEREESRYPFQHDPT